MISWRCFSDVKMVQLTSIATGRAFALGSGMWTVSSGWAMIISIGSPLKGSTSCGLISPPSMEIRSMPSTICSVSVMRVKNTSWRWEAIRERPVRLISTKALGKVYIVLQPSRQWVTHVTTIEMFFNNEPVARWSAWQGPLVQCFVNNLSSWGVSISEEANISLTPFSRHYAFSKTEPEKKTYRFCLVPATTRLPLNKVKPVRLLSKQCL